MVLWRIGCYGKWTGSGSESHNTLEVWPQPQTFSSLPQQMTNAPLCLSQWRRGKWNKIRRHRVGGKERFFTAASPAWWTQGTSSFWENGIADPCSKAFLKLKTLYLKDSPFLEFKRQIPLSSPSHFTIWEGNAFMYGVAQSWTRLERLSSSSLRPG